MLKVSVIHGPNLNLLGHREPNVYGTQTLAELNNTLKNLGNDLNLNLDFYQSNVEGELVNHIQAQLGQVDFIILNAGGYTHTSVAIRDALLAVKIPFIEVHLSNVDKREAFRKNSYLSDIAAGVIYGFGPIGYELALKSIPKILTQSNLDTNKQLQSFA